MLRVYDCFHVFEHSEKRASEIVISPIVQHYSFVSDEVDWLEALAAACGSLVRVLGLCDGNLSISHKLGTLSAVR